MRYSFTSYDTWKYLYTRPAIVIMNEKTEKFYLSKKYDVIESDGYADHSGSFKTTNLPVGTYNCGVMNFAYEHSYDDESYDVSNNPIVFVIFKVKKLKPPTYLKATAGKKRVSLTFQKADGAKKYEIYRCMTKNGSYKRIASTTSNKYVDKTAKTGKRYYYKVRSVRNGKGIVKSKFCTVKRSGKVK